MASPVLEVRNLTIHYRGHRSPVLDGIAFHLSPGEICGLTGDSGCGKTTLAYALIGLLPAAAQILRGSILFRGQELLPLSQSTMRGLRGRMIAMMPQDPEQALNPVLQVGTQVEEVIRSHERTSGKERRFRASDLLQQVGLGEPGIYSAYARELSGGQRQRVVLAQVLAANPVLLLADEPTSALDELTTAKISSLLSDLNATKNTAMLLISHDTSLLNTVGARKLQLSSGSMVDCSPDVIGD